MVLILGATGFIGSHVYSYLNKTRLAVAGTYCRNKDDDLIHFDLQTTSADRFLDEYRPKYVVLAVESHKKLDDYARYWTESYNINAVCMISFLSACFKRGIIPIHISSDNVFDGAKGDYNEDDLRNPITSYGKIRYEVENYIIESGMPYVILRMGKVFGCSLQDNTLLSSLISSFKNREVVRCAIDQTFTPVFVDELRLFIADILSNNYRGIFHIASMQPVTMFQIGTKIQKYYNFKNTEVLECSINSLGLIEDRPLKVDLNISKYKKMAQFVEKDIGYYLDKVVNVN
jgi:dTDP-4-dehydrorhamnose reductase